ncbi:17179_t:CDS:2, partial [Gigaspora margarita]
INQERQCVKNNIEEYWYYIILECNTVHESAILRLQLELTEIQKKAKLQDLSNREIEEIWLMKV